MVESIEEGMLYGQQYGGRRFFRYRASANSWEELASNPIWLDALGAAMLAGKIYITRAWARSPMAVYDVASDTWSSIGFAQQPTVSSSGMIASDGARYLYIASDVSFVRYDPASGLTEHLAPMTGTWGGLRYFEGMLYGHDLNGNETSKTTVGVSGASANTYTYDFADRMIGWTTGSKPGPTAPQRHNQTYYIQPAIGSPSDQPAQRRMVPPGFDLVLSAPRLHRTVRSAFLLRLLCL